MSQPRKTRTVQPAARGDAPPLACAPRWPPCPPPAAPCGQPGRRAPSHTRALRWTAAAAARASSRAAGWSPPRWRGRSFWWTRGPSTARPPARAARASGAPSGGSRRQLTRGSCVSARRAARLRTRTRGQLGRARVRLHKLRRVRLQRPEWPPEGGRRLRGGA